MNKEEKAFIKGAACVIATILRGHGEQEASIVKEAFKACIGTYENLLNADVDPFDLEMLEIFKTLRP
jgi:hypothetical protein